jgi:Maltokinase N-terminal cap domain
MALLHKATLTPSKTELLHAWIPDQPWIGGTDVSTGKVVGAYRFDDPNGEVGIETHLLLVADGQIVQVPVTYRGSPLEGAESSLMATMQHSVLGQRWVYDACGDPVYAAALAAAVLSGGTQAELDVATDSGPKRLDATTRVSGSGTPNSGVPPIPSVSYSHQGTSTVISGGQLELTVLRVIDPDHEGGGRRDAQRLVGTWPGRDEPMVLALVREI